MRVVVLASQKGGTGKSTTCSNLAVAAAGQRSDKVVVVDGDDQASISDWLRDRERSNEALPGSVRQLPIASFPRLGDGLSAARDRGIEWVLIDTEPSTKSTAQAFIELADLVVIPVRPSLPDARSAGLTIKLCETLGKPSLVVLSMAKPRTLALREFSGRLSARARCADTVLYDRQAYPLAFALGLSVTETDPHDTGMQVISLFGEVVTALDPSGGQKGRVA